MLHQRLWDGCVTEERTQHVSRYAAMAHRHNRAGCIHKRLKERDQPRGARFNGLL
jgi:hypothetical protein